MSIRRSREILEAFEAKIIEIVKRDRPLGAAKRCMRETMAVAARYDRKPPESTGVQPESRGLDQ